jgi:hypothetical protein
MAVVGGDEDVVVQDFDGVVVVVMLAAGPGLELPIRGVGAAFAWRSGVQKFPVPEGLRFRGEARVVGGVAVGAGGMAGGLPEAVPVVVVVVLVCDAGDDDLVIEE